MTQTSPKPVDQNTINSQNSKLPSHIGSYTTPSLEELIPNANSVESELLSPTNLTSRSFWQQPLQSWKNFSFGSKLMLLLFTGTAVPVLVLTQINVTLSQRHSSEDLQRALHTDVLIQEDYFKNLQESSRQEAATIAAQVKEATITANFK